MEAIGICALPVAFRWFPALLSADKGSFRSCATRGCHLAPRSFFTKTFHLL
jgi:hypothetical protein